MRRELEDLRVKVKNYDELFNSKDPAYASLLMKRVFLLLQNDNHMLWKILQENLGREWFHKPFLHRNLNYKYHIDYEPLDKIIGDLVKIVIGNTPNDTSKIASTQDCLVLSYMVEAFHNQKAFYTKELQKKDQFEQRLLEGRGDDWSQKQGSYPGDDIVQSSRHAAYSLGSHASPDFEASGEHGSRDEKAQALVRMLLMELGNARAEKLAVYSSYETLRGEYALLEKFVHEVADAAGVVKEGVAVVRLLGKMKKLDQATLIKNNFSKVLAMGKTELIAKTALMVGLSN